MPLYSSRDGQKDKIRPTVPLNIFQDLHLDTRSIDNWRCSNNQRRKFDSFIGVTHIHTGISVLYPAFENDWGKQQEKGVLIANRTLRTIVTETDNNGVGISSPWYQDEFKKKRVSYQQTLADYQGLTNILAIQKTEAVDGVYHKTALTRLRNKHLRNVAANPNTDFLGWAIKSNAYQLSRGTPLQMVFSSSRNMHSQDKDYNRSLWNDKIRQRSPVSVGTVESRDITNIWANAIAHMLSRDLNVPTSKIGVFDGKRHWVINQKTLRKDYILCPEQIRAAPGHSHIYRKKSRALDISENCDVEDDGYLYVQEYLSMSCNKYLEEYSSTHTLGNERSSGYKRIKAFQESLVLCNSYKIIRLLVAKLFEKSDSKNKHSYISYFLLFISYTPERILAEFDVKLAGLINSQRAREQRTEVDEASHWRNKIFTNDSNIKLLRQEAIKILQGLSV